MHRSLAVIEEDELLRTERSELAAELRAYRAGCAGHHHGLAAEVSDDLVHRYLDLVTAKEVFDLHLTDRRLHDLAVDDLVDGRCHEYLDFGVLAVLDEAVGLFLDAVFSSKEDGVDEEPVAEKGYV